MSFKNAIKRFLPASLRPALKNTYASVLRGLSKTTGAGVWGELPTDFFGDRPLRIGHLEHVKHSLFPTDAGPRPWLDREDAESAIQAQLNSGRFTANQAEACRVFRDEGFYIAKGLLSPSFVGEVFEDYLQALKEGTLKLPPGDRRCLNPHFKLTSAKQLLEHPKILEWCNLFLGRPTLPFQTIAAEFGSGQLEHSDAIHMSTYPDGYLIAAWVACEDIPPDSGPLVYYPGSHKLPYHLSEAVGIDQQEFREQGYGVYSKKYEPYIQRLIKERGLVPRLFGAQKGDVLFWHHNLIHGGSPVRNPALTRKSIVCHYFTQGVFCYHDLSGARASVGSGTYV